MKILFPIILTSSCFLFSGCSNQQLLLDNLNNKTSELEKQIQDLQKNHNELTEKIISIEYQKDFHNSEQDIKQIIHKKNSTVLINKYPSIACSKYGDICDNVITTLEVDLTEPSYGDKLTGLFYVRGFLDGKKIGEKQIIKNYNQYSSNSEDKNRILTLKYPFNSNYYLKYYDSMSNWGMDLIFGYELIIKNLETPSSFNGRWIDFYYTKKDGILNINFPL
jgi:hypothetical protein